MPMNNISSLISTMEPEALLGPGVSHSDDPDAKLFKVAVTFSAEIPPMRETIRATSAKEARQFALNKYRGRVKSVKILSNYPASQ